MAFNDIFGARREDERRRAIVDLRNEMARQIDPNAEQTPHRSGLSRVGAFLQNIPSNILGTPRATTEFAPFPEGAEPQGAPLPDTTGQQGSPFIHQPQHPIPFRREQPPPQSPPQPSPFGQSAQQQPPPLPQLPSLQPPQLPPQQPPQQPPPFIQPQGAPQQPPPFLQSSQQQAGAGPAGALREAILNAQSTEDFAAIAQNPDFFPDPAAPAPPTRSRPGDTFFGPDGKPVFTNPAIIDFGSRQGAGDISDKARQGFEQTPGTQRRVPDSTGAFTATSPVLPGPERLTTLPTGSDLVATKTAPGSPTGKPIAEGREAPKKLTLEEQIALGIKSGLDPVNERKLEGVIISSAQDRDNLQDIRRALTGNMDLLRGPGRAGVALTRAQDSIWGGVGHDRAATMAKKDKLEGRIGRTLIAQIKNTSGTAVSDKERQWLKDVSVSLPKNPLSLLTMLDDVITLNDFKLARGTMWDIGGRQGKPWLIQNDHIMATLGKDITNATSLMIQKGQDPAEATRKAVLYVEEKYGISPNGYAAMVEEMKLGALHIGP